MQDFLTTNNFLAQFQHEMKNILSLVCCLETLYKNSNFNNLYFSIIRDR